MQASQPGMSEYGVRNPAMSNAAGQDMLLTTAARGNYNGTVLCERALAQHERSRTVTNFFPSSRPDKQVCTIHWQPVTLAIVPAVA